MKKLIVACLMLSFCAVAVKAMEAPSQEEITTPVLEIVNNSEQDILITYQRAQDLLKTNALTITERLEAGKTRPLTQTEGNKISFLTVKVAGTTDEAVKIAPEGLPDLAESSATISVNSAGGNTLEYQITMAEEKTRKLNRPARKETMQISSGKLEFTQKSPVKIEIPLRPVKKAMQSMPSITKIINSGGYFGSYSQVTIIVSLEAGLSSGIGNEATNMQTRSFFGELGWKPIDLTKMKQGPINLLENSNNGTAIIIVGDKVYKFSNDQLNHLGNTLGNYIVLMIDEKGNLSFKADQKH